MTAEEVLETYKKHERNTRQDLAALITIAEILGAIHETISDLSYQTMKIRKVCEESL